MRVARRMRHLGIVVAIAPTLLFALFPFYWMIVTSMKENRDLYASGLRSLWFQSGPTLRHYIYLFAETQFTTWFLNQVIVGVAVCTLTIVLATLGGYGFARGTSRFNRWVGTAMFATYLVPQAVLFIPMSQVIVKLGIADSLWSLLLTYPTLTIPFSTWLMTAFFRSVPQEMDDAALIDGCSRFGALWYVLFPMVRPGVIAILLYSIVITWQEYLYATTFISSSAVKTISTGVTTDLVRGDVFMWGSLMAAALIGSLPVILIYVLFNRHMHFGFNAGSIK